MPEKTKNHKGVFSQLLKETKQAPEIRQKIIKEIEELHKRNIITFFTSFRYPVMIEDQDAVMLEEVLQNTDIDRNGLTLIINSPGGSGLAAERIINIYHSNIQINLNSFLLIHNSQ